MELISAKSQEEEEESSLAKSVESEKVEELFRTAFEEQEREEEGGIAVNCHDDPDESLKQDVEEKKGEAVP